MSCITEEEVEQIMSNALSVKPHTEEELFEMVKWAHRTRVAHTLLEGVLDGYFKVHWSSEANALKFSRPDQLSKTQVDIIAEEYQAGRDG